MNRTPAEFSAFLESLKVEKEGPEEMHGWRFDMGLDLLGSNLAFVQIALTNKGHENAAAVIEYLLERLSRAEANAKPPTLLEDVKAYMRAGMDAARDSLEIPMSEESEFRRLSEPGNT